MPRLLSCHLPFRIRRLGIQLLIVVMIFLTGWGPAAPVAQAAEILSIRSATRLQVGDQNRSYGVELACVEVAEAQSQAALGWMQRHGPRGTRVNLRPIADRNGVLLARVSVLRSGLDLGAAMVAEGLAQPLPCPGNGGAGAT